eukprot:TRINITY_DN10905_c0_g1_i1.p1 TRINITY_DN10905_c0_g1~~TRINITY_DN10905_c0_g1_i1.p1  ORF type:complete len:115 (+),score=27.00 TRINITY_DN10905_c0_g1_i1:34-345(+)
MTIRVGTTRWSAPEVLRNDGHYTESADVYSFAMVCLEMITRQIPFPNEKWDSRVEDQVLQGIRPPIPDDCPSGAFGKIITQCWNQNPVLRPSLNDVIQRLQAL